MARRRAMHVARLVLAIAALSFLGSRAVAQTVWTVCSNGSNNLCFFAGNLGVGTAFPGERLHIGDGNVLIEGGGETAIKFKRDVVYTGGPSGTSANPIFELGRIVQAGDGDPEFRFFYADDDHPLGRSVFEFDRKGIVASVRQDRGSHFEGFLGTTDPQPVFRLNSYPRMRLEMGGGGNEQVDVAIERAGSNTLSVRTNNHERLRISSNAVAVTQAYMQLDVTAGKPPDADCASSDHVGRMKVDQTRPRMYVCTSTGWGAITLNRSSNGDEK